MIKYTSSSSLSLNRFTVKGWIKCKDAKIEEHKGKQTWNRDAWWVNQNSAETLARIQAMFIEGRKKLYDGQTSISDRERMRCSGCTTGPVTSAAYR